MRTYERIVTLLGRSAAKADLMAVKFPNQRSEFEAEAVRFRKAQVAILELMN